MRLFRRDLALKYQLWLLQDNVNHLVEELVVVVELIFVMELVVVVQLVVQVVWKDMQ